jgi:iron complex transport system substrate-binding protein
MIRKAIYILLAISLCLTVTALPGCTTAQEPTGNYIDDLGRAVEITEIPETITSLAPSNTELIYTLGLEDRLIGVTTYCNYPEEVSEKEVVSEYSNVDIEKIVSMEPDLILADSIHEAEVIPALEDLGMTVFALNPKTIDGILSAMRQIGEITGKTGDAEALIGSLSERISNVTTRTAEIPDEERPRVFFVSWHDPIYSAGTDTMIDELIYKAGGKNIVDDFSGHNQIDLESVIQRNPEVILVLSSMGVQNTSYQYILEEPRFQATDALKNGRVHMVDTDIFGRTTARTVDALEIAAELIQPEIFED